MLQKFKKKTITYSYSHSATDNCMLAVACSTVIRMTHSAV